MGSCLSFEEEKDEDEEEERWPYPPPPLDSSWRVKKGSKSCRHQQMISNGSCCVASLFTQQGKKGTNQDAMVVWENFESREDTVFCGVFDGHGPLGHVIAKKVRDSLPSKLIAKWNKITADFHTKPPSLNEEEPRASTDSQQKVDNNPQIFKILNESFRDAFKNMDKELRENHYMDCFCSGTTAVTLVKRGQNLVIGNIGDSRAVLGTRGENGCLNAVQLTVDLKPNLPSEAKRIRRCKGRVFALRNEPDVARVWLPNNDSPGLAMARAFGDFCLKDYGLISIPKITYRCLTERDEFVVLATDGIWDVLSNKQVVDIIGSSQTSSSAARSLVKSAVQAWKCKYSTSKIDDCAVVCLFLDDDADSEDSVASHSYKENTETSIELSNSLETKNGNANPSNVIALEMPFLPVADAEETETEETDEWSALEGVSRLNTLLTLPRFVGQDKKDLLLHG